jgi:hypothetical protein
MNDESIIHSFLNRITLVYPTDMYKDVDDMDMDSESDTEPKKKKDPTADINEFWTKAPYIKGDKKGRRICKLCQ